MIIKNYLVSNSKKVCDEFQKMLILSNIDYVRVGDSEIHYNDNIIRFYEEIKKKSSDFVIFEYSSYIESLINSRFINDNNNLLKYRRVFNSSIIPFFDKENMTFENLFLESHNDFNDNSNKLKVYTKVLNYSCKVKLR